MNNAVKGVLIFMSGAAAGATCMYFGVKKYFELKADLEIEQVRDAYDRRMEDVDPPKDSVDGSLKGPEEINERVPINSERSYIVKALNNKPPMTDYTKMFKEESSEELELKEVTRDPKEVIEESEEVDPAESEHPQDDIPYDDEEDRVQSDELEMYRMNAEHQKAVKEGREPYEIELSDFELTCVHYHKETLHYYIHDDLLVTDADEVIDPSGAIGDCLESSGFAADERDLLYVRNDILMVDYEIEKVYKAFTEE